MVLTNAVLSWIQEWATVIGSLGSLILSGLLLILYKQQRDILYEQKELSKSIQRAVLRIENLNLLQGPEVAKLLDDYTGNLEPWRVHYDYVILSLSNFGTSPSDNLHFELKMHFGDSDEHLSMRSMLSRSFFIPNQMAFNRDTDVIGAGERQTPFVAPLSAEIGRIPNEWADADPNATEDLAPSEVMYLASEAGESELKIDLILHFSDMTGKREPIKLQSTKFDPSNFQSVGDAVKRGTYVFENESQFL